MPEMLLPGPSDSAPDGASRWTRPATSSRPPTPLSPPPWSSAFVDGDPCTTDSACSIEEILASSGHGLQTLDSIKAPGTGPFLAGLTLTGDVLAWSRDGTPESVVLAP